MKENGPAEHTILEERVRFLFGQSIENQINAADLFPNLIAQASNRLVKCLLQDGKILLCGMGASVANCMHFMAAMLNIFEVERPPLPVISLTNQMATLSSITDDIHLNQVFAKQIRALGQEQDVLLVLTTSGNSNILLPAVDAANDRGMDILALTGRDGGLLANHLGPEDIEIRIPIDNSARIRELHLFILHCFCDLIDQILFGSLGGQG